MSTEQTPKDRVLAWVRSKNPYTMELDFGCMIKDARGRKHVLCERYEQVKGDLYRSVARPNCLVQICKILGSDMGLQELLIAIHECHGMFASTVMTATPIGFLLGDAWSKGNYDLTKNLHEQSPEFYESLLPLLP